MLYFLAYTLLEGVSRYQLLLVELNYKSPYWIFGASFSDGALYL